MTQGSSSSSPPGAKRSSASLYSELRKADRELMEALVEPIRDLATEAKQIALSAKKEAVEHPCKHDDTIKDILKTINGGRNIKIGAVVSIVGIIALTLGGYYAFKDSIEDTQDEMVEVKVDVAEMKGDVSDLKTDFQKVTVTLEEVDKQSDVKNEKHLKQIEAVITNAFKAQNKKPRRNR